MIEIDPESIRPVVPVPDNELIAAVYFGYRWMAWRGRPTTSHPDYPAECMVMQFMSPEQLDDIRWQQFFDENNAQDVTGSDRSEYALAYTYSSSGCTAAIVPNYLGADDILVLKHFNTEYEPDDERVTFFRSKLPRIQNYKLGAFSRAAIATYHEFAGQAE